MTEAELRRNIRATLMPGFEGPDLPEWLAGELRDGLGAVCLFGTNVDTSEQVLRLTQAIHAANPDALIAIDEEGGTVTRLHHREGSPHPSAAYLGSLDEEAVTGAVGASIGAELLAVGVDVNFAPDADVNCNPNNPVIGVRSFGADPHLVARHVAAYTRGLQGAGVAAVAKHFPGHGDTATDSHHALPTIGVDLQVLAARELVPFGAAIAAGTLGVMTSHIVVSALDPSSPATMSPGVLRLLREELGFRGAIISDALDMAGASAGRGIGEAAVLALAAGVDLLCLGTKNTGVQVAGIVEHIATAVLTGRLSPARVTQAAERVRAMSAGVRALRADRHPTSPVAPAHSPDGFWTAHPLAPLVAPVLLQLDSPSNIASGDTVWGIGDHLSGELAQRLPGATCRSAATLAEVQDVLDTARDRALVVQGRDLSRVPFLAEAASLIRRERPDAVLIELGWPQLPGVPPVDIATFGSGTGAAICLIGLLAEGTR